MSFSFRSMFPVSSDESRPMSSAAAPEQPASAPASAMQAPPLNAASPFGMPLFKAQAGEQASASPVSTASSPFSVPSAAPAIPPLTVGDVLAQLPPELARLGSLPPEQPVAVSPQAIDEALRNGRAALPVFEIYRVCPALFQTPVSPQDPRVVPLPAAKLPHFIAAARGASGAASLPPAAQPLGGFSPLGSPAAPVSPAPSNGASPFHAVPVAGTAASSPVMLPPKRQGPPPPLADVGAGGLPTPVSLPGGPAAAFPVSPFAPSASGFAQTASTAAAPATGGMNGMSPFGMAAPVAKSAEPPAAGQPPATPFSPAPASPFAAAGQTPASPFGMASTASPGGAASPFAAIFGDKAVPVSPPAASEAPAPAFAPAAPSPAPLLAAPAMNDLVGPVRIALAGLLKGYTAAELGFDPMVVPAWITTTLPATTLRDLSQSPNPLIELGLLIDGITDVGFRNVLNTARRDFQLRPDSDLLRQALAGNSAPPSLPTLAQLGQPMAMKPAASAPSSMPAGPMRVEPHAPPGAAVASPFAAPSAAPASFTPPASPFSPPAATPEPTVPAPLFTAQMPTAPAAQPPPLPTEAAAPRSWASPPTGGITSPFTPPAPHQAPQDPFSAPATKSFVPPVEPPPVVRPTGPLEPLPSAAGAETPLFAPAKPAPILRPAMPSEGFGSDELLREPESTGLSWSEAAAASAMGHPAPPQRREAPVIDLPAEFAPASSKDSDAFAGGGWAPPPPKAPATPFIPPKAEVDQAPEPSPFRAPKPAPTRHAAASSNVGIHAHDANPDQIVLRALLDTDADLSPQTVVELVCRLPGIAACVCLHEGRAVSHIGAHKPQAREFQKQATQLATHLKTLAPLIGIEGAETFTMNSGDRLMTFCFPGDTVFGVLHDAEPTLGQRDKITLIAREMAKMLS